MTSLAQHSAIELRDVEDLRGSFRRELVGPGDLAYDEQRKVWNGSIDRRPGLP